MNRAYNTKQREVILLAIKKQTKGFLVKDLYEQLGGKIGLSTIYRMVDALADEGVLIKMTTSGGVLYQYAAPCNEADHFYLKCDECGEMTHVDCGHVRGLSQHIASAHGFRPAESHVVINGICKKCIKNEGRNEKSA